MTIDKIQPAALSVARETKADALAGRQQQNAAVQQQTLQRSADVAVLPVKVSVAAKEMAQAVRQVAGDEAFDQKKVDRIRKEILEGRFPIDEERLARKFMELENELGELGRS
jgi:flagellar biosynthesis anti-sigma factor FlgM